MSVHPHLSASSLSLSGQVGLTIIFSQMRRSKPGRKAVSSQGHSGTLQDWAPESGPLYHAHGPIPKPPMPQLKPGGCLPFHPYWTEVFTFHSAVCMLSTKLQGTFFKVAQSTLKGQVLGVLIPWQYFNHTESIQQQLLRF